MDGCTEPSTLLLTTPSLPFPPLRTCSSVVLQMDPTDNLCASKEITMTVDFTATTRNATVGVVCIQLA